MRICIDSNQFIFGISGVDSAAERLMLLLPGLDVVIPRLVMREVTRNLRASEIKSLYALLGRAPNVVVIDEPVPTSLVAKYIKMGLRDKGDAFIGAFAEWQQAAFLISENRHFLNDLREATFTVLTPDRFLRDYLTGSN